MKCVYITNETVFMVLPHYLPLLLNMSLRGRFKNMLYLQNT
jgi:hypothetical protein